MSESKTKILVVEDDFQNRQLINIYLSRSSYDVTLAINGKDAMEKLQNYTPGLIISDISMPYMDGFELYDEVKKYPHLRAIPFIFLTAHSDAEKRRYGKEIGSDDFLTKPIEQEDLLVSLRGKLKRVQEIRTTTEAQIMDQVDELKRSILSTITHEVNTPLFIIKLTANLLLDETMNFKQDELQELLMRIKKSGERLDSLLKDFLISARISVGEAKKEYLEAKQDTDLNFVLTHLLPKFKRLAAAKQLHLEVSMADHLPLLPLHVDQAADIVDRLFSNAVKFNGPDGKISVKTELRSGRVIVEVADTGMGIKKENLDKIFNKFYQVDRNEMEQQGAGLGLTIAKELAEINGGEITAESKEGVGSRFTLVFHRNS